MPRLVHQVLSQPPRADAQPQLERLIATQRQQNRWLMLIALLLAALLASLWS